MNGCESNADSVVYESIEGEQYYRCPLLFVPDCVWRFLEIEKYNKMVNAKGTSWSDQRVNYTKYKMFFEDELNSAKAYKQFLDKEANKATKKTT